MSLIDISIIIFYLVATLVIGIYYGKNVKNLQEYAVGNRSFSVPVMIATIFATLSGGNTVLGTAERIFSIGALFILVRMGDPFYKMLMARYIVPRMGRFADCMSLGDMFKKQFGKSGQILSGVGVLIKSTGSVAGQVSAMGILTSYVVGLPFYIGVIISFLIIVAYSSYGGIKSVIMTDVIQFGVLIIAIPILAAFSVQYAGGYSVVFSKFAEMGHEYTTSEFTWYISLFIFFSVPVFNPSLIQRLLISKNLSYLQKSLKVSALIEVPFLMIICLLVGAALVLNPSLSPNEVVPYLINEILPIGIKGLAIAGMMAVIMSSADSFLNTASIAVINDLVNPLSKNTKTMKSSLLWARLTTVFVGIFAIGAAIYFKNIFNLYIAFLNLWVPVMVVPIYAVIFNTKSSQKDLVLGAVAGIVGLFLWKNFGIKMLNIHPLLVSLCLSAIVFFRIQLWERGRALVEFLGNKIYFPNRLSSPKQTDSYVLRNWWISIRPNVTQDKQFGPELYTFSVFGIVSFLTPFFLMEMNQLFSNLYILQMIGCLLCFGLIIKDFWPQRVRSNISMVWYMALTYALVFFPTLLVLYKPFQIATIIAMASYFILSLLVSWNWFLGLMSVGTASVLIFGKIITSTKSFPSTDSLHIFPIIILASLLIGLIFSRRKQRSELEKIVAVKKIAAEIAHEMRTPLQSISLKVRAIENELSTLANINAKDHMIKAQQISPARMETIKTLPESISSTIQTSMKTINALLMTLRGEVSEKSKQRLDIKDLVESSLKNFPFTSDQQRRAISVSNKTAAWIEGDMGILQHVIHNLLKNAFQATPEKAKGFKIDIWTSKNEFNAYIHIKDTGIGIYPGKILKIFEPFYTSKKSGTGIGLSFCLEVMEVHGGEIICYSKEGEYTEFILIFPLK